MQRWHGKAVTEGVKAPAAAVAAAGASKIGAAACLRASRRAFRYDLFLPAYGAKYPQKVVLCDLLGDTRAELPFKVGKQQRHVGGGT